MGKLRIEPRVKPPVSKEEYDYYRDILQEAKEAAPGNNVFYDLDKKEPPAKARKALTYVADQEGIDLKVRARRGSNTLSLKFGQTAARSSGRMSAAEARKRIVSALSASKSALQKSEIIEKTGVSPATWNLRINELLSEGKVKRQGVGRQTSYSLG